MFQDLQLCVEYLAVGIGVSFGVFLLIGTLVWSAFYVINMFKEITME